MYEIKEDKRYSLEFVANIFCVSKQTLRNWDNNGKFKCIRTEGNQRRYLGQVIIDKLKQQGLAGMVVNNNP